MVDENIDVATILSKRAGVHLSKAYQIHTQLTAKASTSESYFALRAEEREACIEAVILFQASLEAIINEELETEPKLTLVRVENEQLNKKFKMLSFKNKWEKCFDILKVDDVGKKYLAKYLKFYIQFRVPITHAKSRYVDAEKFSFPIVYEGIKSGYKTIEVFYKYLNKYTQEYTWNTFRNSLELP